MIELIAEEASDSMDEVLDSIEEAMLEMAAEAEAVMDPMEPAREVSISETRGCRQRGRSARSTAWSPRARGDEVTYWQRRHR